MPDDRGTVRPSAPRGFGRRLRRAQRLTGAPAARGRHAARRLRLHGGVALGLLLVVGVLGWFPTTVPSISTQPALRASALSLPGLPAGSPVAMVSSLEPAPVPLTVLAPPVEEDDLLLAADGTGEALRALERAQDEGLSGTDVVSASRTPDQLPLFYRHQVEVGETLSAIAARFGVSEQSVVWNNNDLIVDQDLLTVGDTLQVPSVEGIIHSVRLGETLTEIADLYDADVEDIIRFPANGLADPNLLTEGTMILVPGGRIVPRPAPALRPVVPPTPTAEVLDRPVSDLGFVWPVVDLVTSVFGPGHPLGIDINAPYVPVVAAAAGQVVFVGGDPCCSYGFHIDIRHDQGYETRYAHLDVMNVSIGEWVEQGQVVGTSGTSGRSTGPHLHFELRRNGVIQNPLAFLP